MSYASLIKTLPGTFSTNLAVLASLGIHGILWAVLPVLPFESKSVESDSQRSVGLLELTPEEQSRLPSTSEVMLPPFATQPSVLPPLPPPPFQTSVLPLPALPPQLTPNNLSKNSLRASSPQTKTFRVRSPAPTQNNRVPARIATNRPSGTVTNRTYYSEETLPQWRRWTPPPISGLPANRLTAQPFDPNSFPPSPPIVPVPNPPIPQGNTNPPQNVNPPQDQKVATANQPTPLTPTALPEKIPERGKQELRELQKRLATNRAGLPATPAPMTKEQLVQTLRRSPPHSNPAGSESVVTARAIRQLDEYEAQREKVQEDNPKVVTKQPVRQKITTCEKQLNGSVAYINVVVNPQGKVVSGPALYSKTGSIDTQQAMTSVRSYPFRATGDTISYDFAIQFKYETANCSEPTPEPTPQDPQTQQSNS